MSISGSLPENSGRRLFKVLVRSLHLVGVAGTFGNVMMGGSESFYISLAIYSGVVLVIMEAWSGWIWFVQWRGVALYLKLLLLLVMHLFPSTAIPALILAILISGFFAHAPSWIRYYSLLHHQVVHSKEDLLG
jgi:hypothetical protein